MEQVCGRSLTECLQTIKAFHGWKAPGLVLGLFMVDKAGKLIGEEVEFDAIAETRHCLPDAIQLFTPCTVGNGWLKIVDWDKFALTLFDRHDKGGFRVWFDLDKAKAFPNLYNWYQRLVSKKDLPLEILLETIFEAKDSVLSSAAVNMTRLYQRGKKGRTRMCPRCREAYGESQGLICSACGGENYYELKLPISGPVGTVQNSNKGKAIFKTIKLENAVGQVLAHDITEVRPGEFKGRAFEKGHTIRTQDIRHLQRLGKRHLYILELPAGFLHENEAAIAMAEAFRGSGVVVQAPPKEGKVNLEAEWPGLLKVDTTALTRINLLGDVMCASRHTNTTVAKGDIIAGTRAIPLVVEKGLINQAVEIGRSAGGIFQIKPLRSARVGLLITGNEVFSHLIEDRFELILRRKINALGSNVTAVEFAPDDPQFIASKILGMIDSGADLILTTAGMSVDPDDVTREGIHKAGGTAECYGAPILPGAMFMFSEIDTIPILGVPACGLFHQTTIMDIVLPRVLAGEKISRQEIASMGHGGLCLGCGDCRYPKCSFGKS